MSETALTRQSDQWRRQFEASQNDETSGFQQSVADHVETLFADDGDPKAVARFIAAAFCRNTIYADPNQKPDRKVSDNETPSWAWADFTEVVFDAATYSDDAGLQARLAQLIVEMALQPVPTNATGHDIVSFDSSEEFPEWRIMKPGDAIVYHDSSCYFANLPDLDMAFIDWFEGPLGFAGHATGEVTEEGWRKWRNINAFTAHVCVAGRRIPDFKLLKRTEHCGVKTMGFTLEDSVVEEWTDVRAVANWLNIDGEAMYRDPAWGWRTEEDIAIAKAKGPHHFWEKWKEGLQRVARNETASAGNVEAAKEGLRRMMEVERNALS